MLVILTRLLKKWYSNQLRNGFKPKKTTCICANQTQAIMLGSVTLPIYIKNQRFSVKFTVMENLSSDMFLGLPFLNSHQAILDFSSHSMKLSINTPVHSLNYIEIDPFCEIVCTGQIHTKVAENTQGECYSFPTLNDKGILLQKQLSLSMTIWFPLGSLTPPPQKDNKKGWKD